MWLLIWKYFAPPPLRRAAMGEKHHHHDPIFCISALPFVTDLLLLFCLIKTSTGSAALYPSQHWWCSSVVPWRRCSSSWSGCQGALLRPGWEEPPRGGDGGDLSDRQAPLTDALEREESRRTTTAPSCREDSPDRLTSAYWAFQPGQNPLQLPRGRDSRQPSHQIYLPG